MTRRPTQLQIDERTTLGLVAFHEVHGRPPGEPPNYDNAVEELDTWAASPAGRAELERRNIKPWWPT